MPKPPTQKPRRDRGFLHCHLDVEMLAELKALSFEQDVPQAHLVRQFINEGLARMRRERKWRREDS
jgi:hypothetical protein